METRCTFAEITVEIRNAVSLALSTIERRFVLDTDVSYAAFLGILNENWEQNDRKSF